MNFGYIVKSILEKCSREGNVWQPVPEHELESGLLHHQVYMMNEDGETLYLQSWKDRAFYHIDEALYSIHLGRSNHMPSTWEVLEAIDVDAYLPMEVAAAIIMNEYLAIPHWKFETEEINYGCIEKCRRQVDWTFPTYYAAVA